MYTSGALNLKAKKTCGFKSCNLISVYPLDIPSIKTAAEYRDNLLIDIQTHHSH